jgi:hypothetical protein
MEQIMEMLKAMQEKAEADREILKGITEANTKSMREDIKIGQAEIRSIVGAFQEKLDACVASRRDDQKETMSFQETTEAHLECDEQTPVTMESEEKHQEAPKEDAVVKPVKGRKKRHRGRKPTAGRRGEPKELTRRDCGSGRRWLPPARK